MLKQTNTNFKRRLIVAGVSALSFAALMPVASTYAWGPDRPTYTMEQPAPEDHPTFNSITNNNVIGDERDFVRVTEVGGDGKYVNEIMITPGKTYEVYIFYHNNAAASQDGKGVARGVKLRSVFPSKINSSKKGEVSATITSSNATPEWVTDNAFFTTNSKEDVELTFVPATAIIKNQGKINGTILGEQLFGEGIPLGYNSFSGNLLGCSQYSGHVVYRLHAEQANSSVTKTASLDGKSFFKDVTAKPGDTITYKITFKNTGTKDLTNVTFRDKLPTGVTLVPGSVKLYDDATEKTVTLSDAVVANGVNTGLFGEDVTGVLTYKVKVDNDIVKNGSCGTNKFSNVINATTDQTGTKTATSTIKVEKTCEEPPKQDPCKNEDGSVKPECCDKEEYKDLPECEVPDPCKNEDGSIKSECCDKEEYKDLPQCKEEPKTVPELPNTGPGEVALAIVAAVCVITGVSYWYRSQKEVAEIQKGINGDNK